MTRKAVAFLEQTKIYYFPSHTAFLSMQPILLVHLDLCNIQYHVDDRSLFLITLESSGGKGQRTQSSEPAFGLTAAVAAAAAESSSQEEGEHSTGPRGLTAFLWIQHSDLSSPRGSPPQTISSPQTTALSVAQGPL